MNSATWRQSHRLAIELSDQSTVTNGQLKQVVMNGKEELKSQNYREAV
jgi:hypothetical protein